MKCSFYLLLLLLMLSACTTTIRLVGATHDLPSGTVLSASDLKRLDDTHYKHFLWTSSDQLPVTDDPSRLIGGQLVRPVQEDGIIWKADIAQ